MWKYLQGGEGPSFSFQGYSVFLFYGHVVTDTGSPTPAVGVNAAVIVTTISLDQGHAVIDTRLPASGGVSAACVGIITAV